MVLGQESSGQLQGIQSTQLSFYCVQRVDITNPLDTDIDGIDDLFELLNNPLNPLNAGDAAQDFDGDSITNLLEYQYGTDPNTLDPLTTIETSPLHGEEGAAISRETVIYFSYPLSQTAVIDTNVFFAEFVDQPIPGRIHMDPNRKVATLFYSNSLPASARIRVALMGDGIEDFAGREIDADGDGTPGGNAIIDFDTLSLTAISNTIICGRIFASELKDLGGGTNQFVNVPLEGVTITVDGMESTMRAVTDAFGDW
ncbi:MAG: hypothetical protein GKR87_08185 [Kiritimatiellae bacterium]|nr:hypothetical protein [Kiritimatiellia bacterium]